MNKQRNLKNFTSLQSHVEKWCQKQELLYNANNLRPSVGECVPVSWCKRRQQQQGSCNIDAAHAPGKRFLLALPTALKPPLSLLIKTLGNQHPSRSICPFWTREPDVRIYHSYMLNDLGLPTYIQPYLMHTLRGILKRENKLQINSEFRHKVSWWPL